VARKLLSFFVLLFTPFTHHSSLITKRIIKMIKGIEIRIKGLVQGVGFRPFVYRLAKKHNLKGIVLNDSEGVKIKVSGLNKSIERFLKEIEKNPPPLSEIVSIESKKLLKANYKDFSIVESETKNKAETFISPDIGICKDCIADITDPIDRRYLYPFTNCTNCGPRLTIIKQIPYDRPNTTMSSFTMCQACAREYSNPLDRRFHAQPIACPVCGPTLKLLDSKLKTVKSLDPLGQTIKHLKRGKIVAIKGIGGFHLACDATRSTSVARLRALKGREEKPLAIMAFSYEQVRKLAHISIEEKEILESAEKPIMLLFKRQDAPPPKISSKIAPGNSHIGIMLPYSPLHYLLFKYDQAHKNIRKTGVNFTALVMTSANISEEPIVANEAEASKRIHGVFDFMLTHNREIRTRADDSVVRFENGKSRYLRRSRGFAPSPIYVNRELNDVLAVGAELKNTVCITRGNNAFLSQHIGDLKNVENLDFFKESISNLKALLRLDPKTIAFDMHPAYMSSKWALAEKIDSKIAVQHHHAHMASCMAENGLYEDAIGIIADGTGYGVDGSIWGGEILLGNIGSFKRTAHIRTVSMPGGDAAANEPFRMAFSWLYATYGQYWRNLDIDFVNRIGRDRLEFFERMIQSKVNSPMTSSLGRLFDAVAALSSIRDYNSYEGQAAFELEMAALNTTKEHYLYTIYDENGISVINLIPMIEGMVNDLKKREQRKLSSKFHNTVILSFADAARKISKKSGIKKIVLSGGCFQNSYLLKNMEILFKKQGFEVFTHKKVPCNDGGISLGQTVIADQILSKGN
jgi:hydrogenase maturation protein HypF